MENKKPGHLAFSKFLWFSCLVIFFIGLFIFFIGLIAKEKTISAIGSVSSITSSLFMIALLKPAFLSEIQKMKKLKEIYVQEKTRELKEEILSLEADVEYNATKKTFDAYKKGFKIEKCPDCGDIVEGNETYCNKCGKKLFVKCGKCGLINVCTDKFCRSCGKNIKN